MSLLVLASATTQVDVDQRLSSMTALYEQVCIKAFPDDKAVEAMMIAQKAQPLTSDVVKVTMGDDPARGWELADQSATVWLEFPPYHACSVRWNTSAIGALTEYRALADGYEHGAGKFLPIDPYENDAGDIHVHAVGEQRQLPDGGSESLFVFDQHITDPSRRAAGETGFSMRFVHQITSPGAK